MAEVGQLDRGSYVKTESLWPMPELDIPHPEYIIPDTVLWHVVKGLNLDEPHKLGIDPMCGNGTIVNFINEVGGCCYGIELDAQHCQIARHTMSQIKPFSPAGWVIGQSPEILHGDCSEVSLQRHNGDTLLASYIYTSIPFREILDATLGDHIGEAFNNMLVPPGLLGFMVIDSADEAMRNGQLVNPASATIEYFERFGFKLLDRVAFKMSNAPSGCDSQFTELMFVRQEEWEFWKEFNSRPLSSL